MKKVKEYFETYPGHDQCFQTSDGFIFHKDFEAKAHAHSLKDKKIQVHSRKTEKAKEKKGKKK